MHDCRTLPAGPGVYAFHAADGSVLYIGKARSLRSRVQSYFRSTTDRTDKRTKIVRRAWSLSWRETGSELEALLLEYLRIRQSRPPLNRQAVVHRRRRGSWRNASALLVLPDPEPRRVQVCLVSGDGRFHWEGAERRHRVPRGLWQGIRSFLKGKAEGTGPHGDTLSREEAGALAEITLSWLVRHGDRVSRIDLSLETPGRDLMRRVRAMLGEAGCDRVQIA